MLDDLKKPFEEKDIEWRIMQAGEGKNGVWAKVAAYVDARAVMQRFDDALGPNNWSVQYTPIEGGMLCGISVRDQEDNTAWVTKWDGSQNTDVEAVKGGISGSLKRAAVLWGVGRYLYDLGEQFAEVHDGGENFASTKDKKTGKQITFHWDPPPLSKDFLPAGAKPRTPRRRATTQAPEPGQKEQDKPKPSKFVAIAADMAGLPADHVTTLARLQTKQEILAFVDEIKASDIPQVMKDALVASARAKWQEAQ